MMGVEGGEFAGWGKTRGEGRRKRGGEKRESRVGFEWGAEWSGGRMIGLEEARERGRRETNSLLNVMISSFCWSVC
jgi:hypothetical protein